MKISFRITRHGYSCNNINISKNKKILYSDKDPTLTSWGVFETFKHGKEHINYFNSNNIYVSCLVRTWLTAILLYIHHVNKNTPNNKIILLNIVPFLKEKHLNLVIAKDKGNTPDILNKQINKLILLLKYCITFFTKDDIKLFKDLTIIIKSLDLYNISIYIDNKLNIKTEINFIKRDKLNSISGLIKVKDITFKSYNNTFNDNSKKADSKIINIEYINYLKNYKKLIDSNTKKYDSKSNFKLKLKNQIINTIEYNKYKSITPNYDYNGLLFYKPKKNINFFINWYIENKMKLQNFNDNTNVTDDKYNTNVKYNTKYNNKSNSIKNKQEKSLKHNYKLINVNKKQIINNTYDKCIHCVSHSKVMQQFIHSLLEDNDTKYIKENIDFNNIINTNSWSIQLNIINEEINDIYLLKGVYMPTINNINTNQHSEQKQQSLKNKKSIAIRNCETLCYRDKKTILISNNKCSKKIKQYTKKYITNPLNNKTKKNITIHK
jgi:hypothetical protein